MIKRSSVPPRALVISAAAFLVPMLAGIFFADSADSYQLLLWLLALLPGFLLAYYRGWKGAATALAAGMAALSLTQAIITTRGGSIDNWPLLLAVVAAFLTFTIAIGWLSELLHQAREQAEQLALTDELTDIPNRRYARLYLEKEFQAARRGRQLTVVVFDLDHFKGYNDAHGHAAGDAALRTFAGALAATTRSMNLSARWGGEEFLSVLSSADVAGTLIFVDRVRQAFAAAQAGPAMTVSAGVAQYAAGMDSMDALVDQADQALYAAKRGGRDCVRVAPAAEGPAEARLSGAPG